MKAILIQAIQFCYALYLSEVADPNRRQHHIDRFNRFIDTRQKRTDEVHEFLTPVYAWCWEQFLVSVRFSARLTVRVIRWWQEDRKPQTEVVLRYLIQQYEWFVQTKVLDAAFVEAVVFPYRHR